MSDAAAYLAALSPAKRRALAARLASPEFRASAVSLLARWRAGEKLNCEMVAEDLQIPPVLVQTWFAQIQDARHGVIGAHMAADA